MRVSDERLRDFVEESNRIEGMKAVYHKEIEAHRNFLSLERPTIDGLREFVSAVQERAVLRERAGLNVRVGNHFPPSGGPEIVAQLQDILDGIDSSNPYQVHQRYEHLHPFTDGNGRSGRALWLWHMVHRKDYDGRLGFLHAWYYQSLATWRPPHD